MLTILSILLLFIPTIFQHKIGNKSLDKSINIKFIFVCIISLILQFIITILSFLLAIYSITGSGLKCGTGAVGIFFFSFVITCFMLVVIFIQFLNRKKIVKN
jgi:hypothetical protein